MKKIFTILVAAMMVSTLSYAQSTKETIKERKAIAKLAKSELTARASRVAKKAAKEYKKEGWGVMPGQLPLEKQLDKTYQMYYEYEENGLPKYIYGEASSISEKYNVAKGEALEFAKEDLAGMIQTEVTSLIETTRGNQSISADDAATIENYVQASKSLIAQSLGRVFAVTEVSRTLKNKNVEVYVKIAYNSKMALDFAKETIKAQLEAKGQDLHEQLDAIWEGANL